MLEAYREDLESLLPQRITLVGGQLPSADAGSNEMGLPAVLGLMEQMRGGTHLHSRSGAGTRVVLLLSVEPGSPEGTPEAAKG